MRQAFATHLIYSIAFLKKGGARGCINLKKQVQQEGYFVKYLYV